MLATHGKGNIVQDIVQIRTGYYLEPALTKAYEDSRGTEGRNRTDTPVKEPDFESGASTSSATPARERRRLYIQSGDPANCDNNSSDSRTRLSSSSAAGISLSI